MAVSQVERLKKPWSEWMWKIFVASQPPSRAPATPIRQVMIRPCCLRPGISMLARRPAARPRIIQAIMPMTGSLVGDQIWHAVVGHAGQVAADGEFPACSAVPGL